MLRERALCQIRTDTGRILSPLPLPVGLREQIQDSKNNFALPLGDFANAAKTGFEPAIDY